MRPFGFGLSVSSLGLGVGFPSFVLDSGFVLSLYDLGFSLSIITRRIDNDRYDGESEYISNPTCDCT